jgi:ankyrin repeat protein
MAAIIWIATPAASLNAADDRARVREAVVRGNSENLKALLQLPGVTTLIANKNDNDFLYLAVEQMSSFRYNGSDASAEELERSRSADARQAEVIKILLENGATASVNGAKPRPPALIHAVRLRATQCVNALVNAGANPNIMDNGYRPLPMAAKNGATAPEIVQLLLDAKADPNGADKEYGYPLVAILDHGDWNYDAYEAFREKIKGRYELLRKNSKATVEMLLQAGADPSVGLQVTLLHEKPAAADSELIPMFLNAGGLKKDRYPREQALADLLRTKVDRGWPDTKYARMRKQFETGGP